MPKRFESQDMANTIFHDINLYRAEFEDVNLAEAEIHNANLANVRIYDANILGMTIYGIRVDQLIEAELDRRNPDRVKVRITHIHDLDEVKQIMANYASIRKEYLEKLLSLPVHKLTARPAPDRWSVVEHLRHLVFADEMYINRWILRNDKPRTPIGMLPPFLENNPAFAEVGTEPTDDIEAVITAWQQVHRDVTAWFDSITADDLKVDTRDVDFGQGCVGAVLRTYTGHGLEHLQMAMHAAEDVT